MYVPDPGLEYVISAKIIYRLSYGRTGRYGANLNSMHKVREGTGIWLEARSTVLMFDFPILKPILFSGVSGKL